MDHCLILFGFPNVDAENVLEVGLQEGVRIDLCDDILDCLVGDLLRSEDRIDNSSIVEDNVAGERNLKGALGRTNGLRTGGKRC